MQIHEIITDVSHASLAAVTSENNEIIETKLTNEYNISETENERRKFNGNLETMENDLSEFSSRSPVCLLNASNEIPDSFEHSSRSIYSITPSCSSVKQQDYFTRAYPSIIFSNGKIGCRECRSVNSLGLHAEQSQMSKEWIECTVFSSKAKSRKTSAAQKYLRKKSASMQKVMHT